MNESGKMRAHMSELITVAIRFIFVRQRTAKRPEAPLSKTSWRGWKRVVVKGIARQQEQRRDPPNIRTTWVIVFRALSWVAIRIKKLVLGALN